MTALTRQLKKSLPWNFRLKRLLPATFIPQPGAGIIFVLRSAVRGAVFAEPVLGKSGLINTMIKANGLAHIPAGKEGVEAGEIVDVKLF